MSFASVLPGVEGTQLVYTRLVRGVFHCVLLLTRILGDERGTENSNIRCDAILVTRFTPSFNPR